MAALTYMGRSPDSDGVVVPKAYADTANTAQALTTTQVNNLINPVLATLTTQSYVDSRDVLLAHKSAVDAADATYLSAALLNAANGVAGLDGSGNVLSSVLPPLGTITTDRVITGYSLGTVVGFDAVGTPVTTWNNNVASATLNGAHSAVGGLTNVVLAFFDVSNNMTADTGPATLSVTYGGVAMTPVPGSQLNYSHPATGIYGNCAVFYLFNPPTGSQTVAYTISTSATGFLFATGNTVSYTNVASLGTLATNSGTASTSAPTLSLSSVPCAANGKVAMMFGSVGGGGTGVLASFNQTQRYINNTASTGVYAIIGDAGGTSTESFTASQTLPSGATSSWVAVGVPLNPPSSPTATGITHITAPVTITSTSSTSTLASITVADPGFPWRPLPLAWVQGDSSGSSVPANRSTGTGSYGLLTVAAPSGGQVYGLGLCTGSYFTDTYPLTPYAAAGQTPTSVPAITGSQELDLNAGLWSGTTFTYYPTNLIYQVLVVPAV